MFLNKKKKKELQASSRNILMCRHFVFELLAPQKPLCFHLNRLNWSHGVGLPDITERKGTSSQEGKLSLKLFAFHPVRTQMAKIYGI